MTPRTVATGLLCPWDSPGKNTRMGSHSLLQGIFQIQGSNPGLPRCRQFIYHLSHQGSPDVDGVEDSADFVSFFPDFVWTLRDFSLNLEADGQSITADEYLENSLKLLQQLRSGSASPPAWSTPIPLSAQQIQSASKPQRQSWSQRSTAPSCRLALLRPFAASFSPPLLL